MPLAPGTRVGIYEITGSLGAGGMGEVYRARDTRLKRDVALKILPDSFASDADRLARFQREAEVLASLNHPNIAAIYGIEESPVEAGHSLRALVLELVEGETLADRIARGAITVDEALPLARQIAEALEAAHEQGIIHRDLKPANIKVRPDGTVKVLDFGLAKLNDPNGPNLPNAPNVSNSPTITSPAMLTGVGMLLGTAAYMSPEQAKGQDADRRSDLWAFGCVLYEMLTGRRAFDGQDVAETLAAVLRGNPEWARLPAETPSAVRRLLVRCLSRDRASRLDSASVARLDLIDARLDDDSARTLPGAGLLLRASVVAAVVGVLAFGGGLFVGRSQAPAVNGNLVLLEASVPAELALAREPFNPVMSPDGRFVAFAGQGNGIRTLYLRSMTDGSIRDLASPVTGGRSFWVPDSRSIVFVADGAFWRTQVEDRQRVRLGDGPPGNFFGGSANSSGTMIFGSTEGIYRVVENGAPERLLAPREGDGNYVAPTFLPDGNRFVFTIRDGPRAGVSMGRLGSDAITLIVPGLTADVQYAAGQLVYTLEGQVISRSVNVDANSAVAGDPQVLVAEGAGARVHSDADGDSLSFSYGPFGMRQLVSFDRMGRMLSRLGMPGQFREIDITPDGRRLAANQGIPGELSRISVVDVETGAASPLTVSAVGTGTPRWGGDTRRVFFNAYTNGAYAIYARDVATGETKLVRRLERTDQYLDDVSPDGSVVLYHESTDIWSAPAEQAGQPVRVVHILSGALDQSSFSPDMRYVAFNSTETGRPEVGVVPAQPDGRRWQISRNGGAQPIWSADGSQLFYLAPDGTLMSVAVPRGANDWNDAVSRPMFSTGVGLVDAGQEQYVVSPRGDRFFVTVPIENPKRNSFGVLVGWRRLVSGN